MNCSKCGTYNEPNSKVCFKCGNELLNSYENQNIELNGGVNQSSTTIPNLGSNTVNNLGNQINNPNMKELINNNQTINLVAGNTNPPQPETSNETTNSTIPNLGSNTVNNLGNQINNPNMKEPINNNQTINLVAGNTNPPQPETSNTNLKNKKPNFKLLIFILIGVLLISGVVVGSKVFFKKSSDNVENKVNFNENELILAKQNNKYGYINIKGEVVIDFKYDTASEFKGKYAYVQSNSTNSSDKNYYIIDERGNVKLSDEKSIYTNVKPVGNNEWIFDGKLYDSNLKQVSSNNLVVDAENNGDNFLYWKKEKSNEIGVMNLNGKITYTYKGDKKYNRLQVENSTLQDDFKDQYCIVTISDENYTTSKRGIINCNSGKIIYDYTTNIIENKDNNVFEIHDNSQDNYVYIQDDKILYKSKDDQELDYYKGYIEIEDEDRYIDISNGNIVSKDEISKVAYRNKKQGYSVKQCSDGDVIFKSILMKDKEEIAPCKWISFEFFDSDFDEYLRSKGKEYVVANGNGSFSIIDTKTKQSIYEVKGNSILISLDSPFISYLSVSESSKSVREIYNLFTQKKMTVDPNASIATKFNYVTVSQNNQKKYYNSDMNLIFEGEI